MSRTTKIVISTTLAAALSTAAGAAEFVIGFGQDDFNGVTNTQAPALMLEYHKSPFYKQDKSTVKQGFALQIDGDGDVWIAAGFVGTYDINDRWFFEGSLMTGLYWQAPGGTPLNYPIEFREQVGIGYRIDENRAISITIDHKSNADISLFYGLPNPGTETLAIRYRARF